MFWCRLVSVGRTGSFWHSWRSLDGLKTWKLIVSELWNSNRLILTHSNERNTCFVISIMWVCLDSCGSTSKKWVWLLLYFFSYKKEEYLDIESSSMLLLPVVSYTFIIKQKLRRFSHHFARILKQYSTSFTHAMAKRCYRWMDRRIIPHSIRTMTQYRLEN